MGYVSISFAHRETEIFFPFLLAKQLELSEVGCLKGYRTIKSLGTTAVALSEIDLQCLAKVFGPLELCDLLPHFRLQT